MPNMYSLYLSKVIRRTDCAFCYWGTSLAYNAYRNSTDHIDLSVHVSRSSMVQRQWPVFVTSYSVHIFVSPWESFSDSPKLLSSLRNFSDIQICITDHSRTNKPKGLHSIDAFFNINLKNYIAWRIKIKFDSFLGATSAHAPKWTKLEACFI